MVTPSEMLSATQDRLVGSIACELRLGAILEDVQIEQYQHGVGGVGRGQGTITIASFVQLVDEAQQQGSSGIELSGGVAVEHVDRSSVPGTSPKSLRAFIDQLFD